MTQPRLARRSEPRAKDWKTRLAGQSASTWWTRRSTETAVRIQGSAGSRTALKRQASFGSRFTRTPGTPGRGRAEGGRHQTGAAEAPGHELTGGALPGVGEIDEIGTAVPARTGDRVVKIGIDAAKSGAPTARGAQAVKASGRLEGQEASESRDQNGWTSKGYREPELSEQLTVEKHPARVAGTLLEGRALTEQYRQRVATGTGSPTVKEDKVPKNVATVERWWSVSCRTLKTMDASSQAASSPTSRRAT